MKTAIKEAEKLIREGDSHSKTGIFKWKANWGDAADAYERAAEILVRENQYEKAIGVYEKASHAYYKFGIYYKAGTTKMGQVKALKETEKLIEMIEATKEASNIFLEDGKPDRAAESLEKCAKVLKKYHKPTEGKGKKVKKRSRFAPKVEEEGEEESQKEKISKIPTKTAMETALETIIGKELKMRIKKTEEAKVVMKDSTFKIEKKSGEEQEIAADEIYKVYYKEGEKVIYPFLMVAIKGLYKEAVKLLVEGDKAHLARTYFDDYTTYLIRCNDIKGAIENIYASIPSKKAMDLPHRILEAQISIIGLHIYQKDIKGAYAAEEQFIQDTTTNWSGSHEQNIVQRIYDAIEEKDQETYERQLKDKAIKFLLNEVKLCFSRIKCDETLKEALEKAKDSKPTAVTKKKLEDLLAGTEEGAQDQDLSTDSDDDMIDEQEDEQEDQQQQEEEDESSDDDMR